MGSVTGNFQSETPLHPAARAFLADAFDRGWADPAKIHNQSRQAAILVNEAKEVFASHFGVRPDELHFLADPMLGFHLGISGLIKSKSRLFYSAVDRSEVFAIAQETNSHLLEVSLDGSTTYLEGDPQDVLAWLSANGETGIKSQSPTAFNGQIFVDATASGSLLSLPQRWDCALWNSRAWQGPESLGILAIGEHASWSNPLPHLDQAAAISHYSPPLLMASAIALEAFHRDFQERQFEITALNARIRSFIAEQIENVDIAGDLESTLPNLLSFSFLYIDAQMLVSELDRQGFAIDSGSACNSSNMEPSHVLAAMGLLTHGNVRLTLQPQTTEESVDRFLHVLKDTVAKLRR